MNFKLSYEITGFKLTPLNEIYLEQKLKNIPLKFFKISFDGEKFRFETTFFNTEIVLKTNDFQVLIQLVKTKLSMLYQRQKELKKKKKKYKNPNPNIFVEDYEGKKEN